MVDQNLSVETYNFLRLDLQEHGFDAFPAYYKVQQFRNSCYRPDIPNPDSLEELTSIDETQSFDSDESVVNRNVENF